MKTVTVTNVSDEEYHGYDHGADVEQGLPPAVSIEPGEAAAVSEEKAEQLLADHPDRFAAGNVAPKRKSKSKSKSKSDAEAESEVEPDGESGDAEE